MEIKLCNLEFRTMQTDGTPQTLVDVFTIFDLVPSDLEADDRLLWPLQLSPGTSTQISRT